MINVAQVLFLIGFWTRVRRWRRQFAAPNQCFAACLPLNKGFTCTLKYVIYITLMEKPCNTQQAARAVGISMMTLHRWIVAKRLDAPRLRIRNGRAVRLWGNADLAQLRKLKQQIYCKGRGRKKGYKRK